MEKAEAEFDRLLPQGLHTPFQYFYSIQCATTGSIVGTLWVSVAEDGQHRCAFICDLQIEAACRRKGHARQALLHLEALLARSGVSSIGLHAFSHNPEAISLYMKLGFGITSVNMHKPIAAPCQAIRNPSCYISSAPKIFKRPSA